MDDVIAGLLEQIAFSGSIGVLVEQLWHFVDIHFQKLGEEQTIDFEYKRHLWNLLVSCPEIVVSVKSPNVSTLVPLMDAPTADLHDLITSHGEALTLCTTERQQWLTLTGHGVDHKEVPPLEFACLSAISSKREVGITLPDLYAVTGQDKRSAPLRCKKLAARGLVHGFPVLVNGFNTTQYVHKKFLADNLLFRDQEAVSGSQVRTLDLHKVRKGISDLLLGSTNRIMKLRDCCQLMHMTKTQSDRWTQRRFHTQVLLLAQAGYIKRIRVPGMKTGTLILCIQLLKEYRETDDFMLRKERQLAAITENQEGDSDEDDLLKEEGEDIDLSDLNFSLESHDISGSRITREALFELQVSGMLQKAGSAGLSGPAIRKHLFGNFWHRPFDEQMKKIAPNAAFATQPPQYSSLAVGPAVDEVVGRTFHYRYYSLSESWAQFGNTDSNCHAVAEQDGLLPHISNEICPIIPPRPGSRSTANTAEISRPTTSAQTASYKSDTMLFSTTPKKRGRPSKASKVATPLAEGSTISTTSLPDSPDALKKKAEEEGSRPRQARIATQSVEPATTRADPAGTTTAHRARLKRSLNTATSSDTHREVPGVHAQNNHPQGNKRKRNIHDDSDVSLESPSRRTVSKPGRLLRNQRTLDSNLPDSTDPLLDTDLPDRLESSVGPEQSDQDVPQVELESVGQPDSTVSQHVVPAKTTTVALRELVRKTTTNTTLARRKQLLLEMIGNHGGIAVFGEPFMLEYDQVFLAQSGIKQSADRKTLKRALDQLVDEKQLKMTVRVLKNHTGRVSMRKDIFYLYAIPDDGPELKAFIASLKAKEALVKASTTPHKTVEVVARPEMDIIPLMSQQASYLKASRRSFAKAEGGTGDLRVRLSQKIDNKQNDENEAWFRGRKRLPSLEEMRAARHEEIQQRKLVEREKRLIRRGKDPSLPPIPARNRKLQPGTSGSRPWEASILSGTKISRTRRQINVDLDDDTRADATDADEVAGNSAGSRAFHEYVPGNNATKPSDLERRSVRTRASESSSPGPEDSHAFAPLRTHADLIAGKTRTPKRIISKRADRFEAEEAVKKVDDLRLENNTKRRRLLYTDEEDDILIRAVCLSNLFFSKSEAQPKIAWSVVNPLLHDIEEEISKRRYASVRNRPRYRTLQRFILSTTFAQLYNEAVYAGTIDPVPRSPFYDDGTPFDLTEMVQFTRRHDPEKRITFSDPLPDSLMEFEAIHTVKRLSNSHATNWTDDFFGASSNTIKAQILHANSFHVHEDLASSQPTTAEEVMLSAVKALLLTPEKDYQVSSGPQFLLKHGDEKQIERTITSMLQTSTVVALKGDSERIGPGRNYQLSERFFHRLRAPIPYRTFSTACAFDRVIKEGFDSGRTVLYPSLANNGASAATLELAIRKKVYIEHGQRHWGDHGLIHDYGIRQIDASVLDFDLILVPGSQTWETPSPPKAEPVGTSQPYCWIDTNGELMVLLYYKVLSLILSQFVLRGRLTRSELLRLCTPVLVDHELQACMQDLLNHGRIKRTADGGIYELDDHYYLAVPPIAQQSVT